LTGNGPQTGRPAAGFHTHTVPSVLLEASSSRPSGVVPNATEDTSSLWPMSGSPARLPATGSHTRTVASPPPEASSSCPRGPLPSATEDTRPVWPLSDCSPDGEAGDRVPHPHRPVGAAGGQQQLPAGGGAERHRGQLPGVADERLPRGRPVTGSHTRTVPSVLPETSSSRPSRVVPNATEDTSSLWAASGSPTRLPVTGSHTRTVLWLPEASSRRPSGPLLCRSKIRLHG